MSHIPHLERRNGKTMLIVHDQPLILLAGEVHNSNAFTATQGYLFGMDMTDPALKTPQDVEEYGWFARTLNDLMPLLAERIGTAKLQAVCSERKEDCTLDFGDFRVMAAFDHPMLAKKDGVYLGIQTAPDECILLVNRCGLMFDSGREDRPNKVFIYD